MQKATSAKKRSETKRSRKWRTDAVGKLEYIPSFNGDPVLRPGDEYTDGDIGERMRVMAVPVPIRMLEFLAKNVGYNEGQTDCYLQATLLSAFAGDLDTLSQNAFHGSDSGDLAMEVRWWSSTFQEILNPDNHRVRTISRAGK